MNAKDKPGHPANPATASEARITLIKHGDRVLRDMDCPTCAEWFQTKGMVPYHDASERCESGKRTHCTCDTCF